MYQGLRDFRTKDPAELRADLQRQNTLIEREAEDIRGLSALRWNPTKTDRDFRAVAGDAVLIDATAAVRIFLPPSNEQTRGRGVRAVRVNGSATISVVPPSGELVNGDISVGWASSPKGWVEFMADGRGGWWSEPL